MDKGTNSDVSFSRHGWGCTPDPAEAVKYLSSAASNAASVEDLALRAGLKKGGAAKGELVLAIFELANCFRHGWGVQVDKFAAKQVRPLEGVDRGEAWNSSTDHWGQYYETAANLGDTGQLNLHFRLNDEVRLTIWQMP
jgi:hypothetical protein